MNVVARQASIFASLLLAAAGAAQAQIGMPGIQSSGGQDGSALTTKLSHSQVQTTGVQNWREWDHSQWTLTDAEWTRYEEIMRGPRGAWSPNLDPVTALGVEARTDEERDRYAVMLMEQERDRTGKELALIRAYTGAWVRYHGNDPMFNAARLGGSQAPAVSPFQPGDSISFFMTTDCTACIGTVRAIASHLGQGALYPTLDIYFLDGDSASLQKWAHDSGLPAQVFNSGVTINLDGGLLARLQKNKSPTAPVAYRRRGDDFAPIQPEALYNDALYPPKTTSTSTEIGDFIKRLGKGFQ